MNEDLYELLDVATTASEREIKTAYRYLAMLHHPDRGGDPDEFVKITMAYNVLMDPEARQAYDLAGDVVDDHPMKVQEALIQQLGELLEAALDSIDGPVEENDIVKLMRHMRDGVEKDTKEREAELTRKLKSLHKARTRIIRKGEEKNVFIDIMAKKILEYSDEYQAVTKRLRELSRMRDELERYDSIVDVIRTVQSGIYAAKGRRPTISDFLFPART